MSRYLLGTNVGIKVGSKFLLLLYIYNMPFSLPAMLEFPGFSMYILRMGGIRNWGEGRCFTYCVIYVNKYAKILIKQS